MEPDGIGTVSARGRWLPGFRRAMSLHPSGCVRLCLAGKNSGWGRLLHPEWADERRALEERRVAGGRRSVLRYHLEGAPHPRMDAAEVRVLAGRKIRRRRRDAC